METRKSLVETKRELVEVEIKGKRELVEVEMKG